MAVLALVVGWRATRPADRPSGSNAVEATATVAVAATAEVAVNRAEYDPTPFFGSYRSLHLYLPVPVEELTEIGFHQASNKAALNMDSLLPDADMGAAADKRGTGRQTATETVGPAVLTGSVLRMWRSNRTGPPNTAVDVGAAPGTPVYAPVTGEVVHVRPYRLYDKYDDYEIHIRPNGWAEVDVVLIHVEAPTVSIGDRVVGGCTQIATVRKLSDRVTHQISEYTTDAGDHVHIQLNRLEVPGKLDFVGDS